LLLDSVAETGLDAELDSVAELGCAELDSVTELGCAELVGSVTHLTQLLLRLLLLLFIFKFILS
jgi:hypothetical protein